MAALPCLSRAQRCGRPCYLTLADPARPCKVFGQGSIDLYQTVKPCMRTAQKTCSEPASDAPRRTASYSIVTPSSNQASFNSLSDTQAPCRYNTSSLSFNLYSQPGLLASYRFSTTHMSHVKTPLAGFLIHTFSSTSNRLSSYVRSKSVLVTHDPNLWVQAGSERRSTFPISPALAQDRSGDCGLSEDCKIKLLVSYRERGAGICRRTCFEDSAIDQIVLCGWKSSRLKAMGGTRTRDTLLIE